MRTNVIMADTKKQLLKFSFASSAFFTCSFLISLRSSFGSEDM